MKNILSILVLSALLFTSCKKEETTDSAPPEEIATDTTVTSTDSLATTAETTTAQQVSPAANGNISNTVMGKQSVPSAAPVVTAKGMNPAHGQPGHRCDISVGAPLNSPPGKSNSTTTTAPGSATVTKATTVTPGMMNQTGNSPSTTNTTPVVTAPGMNPAHGQEGHVCSVAVGTPLPK